LRSSDHERKLIAYEIHDGLAQHLAAATMHLETAWRMRDEAPDTAVKVCTTGMDLLRQSLYEARRLISDVRPMVLDEQGVEAAVSHLVHEDRGPDAPPVEFHSDVSFQRLEPIVENAIYRIVQEAITNACKHSHARQVHVRLSQQGRESVRVQIDDDGSGFDPNTQSDGSFGLKGIRERARLLGGKATIASSDQGTCITVDLPLVVHRPSVENDTRRGEAFT
jgi:two-component system sensor histidine kinase DegS